VDLLYNKLYCNSTTNPQLFDFSTNPQQIHNKSKTSRHVKMLWICCGLDKKFTTNRNNIVWLATYTLQVEKLYNESTANPQLHDKSYNLLYNKSTANPQQIEQVEFELKCCSHTWTRYILSLNKTVAPVYKRH
jgi:hypothetical protein